MAGEWIKVRTNLWNDPRVSQLCDKTGAIEATIIGALYWLWATADEHTETGVLVGLSLGAVDRKTGIPGFGNALVAIGWVTTHPEGIQIERFEEHNGASAKNRAQTAKRVAAHKNGSKVTQEPEKSNGKSVSGALPREEKIREDKEKNKATSNPLPNASADPIDLLGDVIDPYATVAQTRPQSPTEQVFTYWKQTMCHPQAKLDGKRNRAITGRLKDGYTVEQICQAVDGCKYDPFSQGANNRSTIYDDIELICRSGPKVDAFIKIASRGPPKQDGLSDNTRQQVANLQRYMEENPDESQ